jgi:hypothetical protein
MAPMADAGRTAWRTVIRRRLAGLRGRLSSSPLRVTGETVRSLFQYSPGTQISPENSVPLVAGALALRARGAHAVAR